MTDPTIVVGIKVGYVLLNSSLPMWNESSYDYYIILCEGQVLQMGFMPVSTQHTEPAPCMFSYLVTPEGTIKEKSKT